MFVESTSPLCFLFFFDGQRISGDSLRPVGSAQLGNCSACEILYKCECFINYRFKKKKMKNPQLQQIRCKYGICLTYL